MTLVGPRRMKTASWGAPQDPFFTMNIIVIITLSLLLLLLLLITTVTLQKQSCCEMGSPLKNGSLGNSKGRQENNILRDKFQTCEARRSSLH